MPDASGDAIGSDDDPVQTVELDIRTVLAVLVTLVAIFAVASIAVSSSMTVLVAVGVLLAFAVDPIVDAIQRSLKIRRGYAVALLCGTTILVTTGLVVAFGQSTIDQARSFQDDLPRVVNDLSQLPLIGSTLAENQVPEKISEWAATLPRQLAGNTSQFSDVAETVTTLLLSALGVALVTVSLLIDGPWLVANGRRLIPVGRRATADTLGRVLDVVIGRYFAGSLLLAALQAAQVLITGLILDVPLSPLLAVWAGVWNLVPQIGGAIGGALFVAVAFTQGPTVGVIAAIVFMVYLTFANNVLLPIVLGRAVDISPLTTMVATIAGFSVGGILGAMVAVPLLGAGKAMYYELRPSARPEPPPPEEPRPPGPVRRVVGRVRPGGGGGAPAPAG